MIEEYFNNIETAMKDKSLWSFVFLTFLMPFVSSKACTSVQGVCFTATNSTHSVADDVIADMFSHKLEVTLTSGVTYVLGAVGGTVGYLFHQDKQFSGVPFSPDPLNLCLPPNNKDEFPGKMLVVERGECYFDVKSIFASVNGATGLAILTNINDDLEGMKSVDCLDLALVTNENFAAVLVGDIDHADFVRHFHSVGEISKLTIGWAGVLEGDSCKSGKSCAGGMYTHNCQANVCECESSVFDEVVLNNVHRCEKKTGIDAHMALRNDMACNEQPVYPGGTDCSLNSCVGFPDLTGCVDDVCQCALGYHVEGTPGTDGASCIPDSSQSTTDLSTSIGSMNTLQSSTEDMGSTSNTAPTTHAPMTTSLPNASSSESSLLTENMSSTVVSISTLQSTTYGSDLTSSESTRAPNSSTYTPTSSTGAPNSSAYALRSTTHGPTTVSPTETIILEEGEVCDTALTKQRLCNGLRSSGEIRFALSSFGIQSLQHCMSHCFDSPDCCGMLFNTRAENCDVISVGQNVMLHPKEEWLFFK